MSRGWETRLLPEVADLSTPSRPTINETDLYPFVPMAAIDDETGLETRVEFVPGSKVTGSKSRFLRGDILFAKITPCVQNGKIALAPDLDEPVGFATSEIFRIGPSPQLDRRFLLYFLRSPWVRRAAEATMTGSTGRQRVPRSFLESLELPVPPLAEQLKVVVKLDAAFQRLRSAQNTTAEAQATLSVAEFSWVEFLLSTDGDHPQAQLREVSEVMYGVTKNPDRSPGSSPVPYLRVANVQNGFLDLSEIKFINVSEMELERWMLLPGDVLLCEGNSFDLVGRAAMFRGEIDNCVHQNHVIRVRPDSDAVRSEFLLAYLNSRAGHNYFRRKAKRTTNLATINSTEVREMPIPIPPLSAQEKIVDLLGQAKDRVARIQQECGELRNLLRATEASLLERAFRGEL